MKIIITENQYNIIKENISLKEKLLNVVKEYGFDTGIIITRSSDKLKELAFDNDPMEFLNLYNDLKTSQSDENLDWVLFSNEKDEDFIFYSLSKNIAYIDYIKIWSILEEEFNLSYVDAEDLTQKWLSSTYGLTSVKTQQMTL
jgi:hypothetical protein